jgi:hypothetical protein
MSWGRRVDNIRQRDWSDIVNHWSAFGNGYDTRGFLDSSLEENLELRLDPATLNANAVIHELFEQRTVFLGELVFSQIKANHALLCALRRIEDGNASWGVADAYHASMQLMKSILAAFGIFICRVHDRYVLIDAFPWSGRIDDQRKYRKQHTDWEKRAAVICSVSKEFSQTDLFSLFQRVLNISTVPTTLWPEVVVRNIIKTPKGSFSASRNKVIYGSRFWFDQDDMLGECLSVNWTTSTKRDMSVFQFTKDSTATEIDCYLDCWVLFVLSRNLHQDLYKSFSDTIGVFDYVEGRRSRFGILEAQFSTVF